MLRWIMVSFAVGLFFSEIIPVNHIVLESACVLTPWPLQWQGGAAGRRCITARPAGRTTPLRVHGIASE